MKNQSSRTNRNQNKKARKKSQAEMQRTFIDLQFERSELDNQLKNVNKVLFSLGKEMEEYFTYDQIYK